MKMDRKEMERLRDICAYLYVERRKSQSEIAEHLGVVSRPMVQRLLEKAREKGIIEMKLNLPSHIEGLEGALIARFAEFGLRDARVCRDPGNHEIRENGTVLDGRDVAKMAAELFESLVERLVKKLPDGKSLKIGLAGADLMINVVSHLQQRSLARLEIYAISAGVGSKISSNAVVGAMASRYRGAKSHELQVPAYVSKETSPAGVEEEKKRLLKESNSYENFMKARDVDILMTGLGIPSSSSVKEIIDALDFQEVEGAVGDMNYQIFDKNGIPIRHEYNDRVIAVKLEDIKKMAAATDKYVIAAAGGNKLEPILAALKGRLLNTLVTDERTARALTEHDDQ